MHKTMHLHICYHAWQGCQFWNRMFEEEMSKVDVGEVRQLLDCSDVDREEGQG
jgi:hypothetical protein